MAKLLFGVAVLLAVFGGVCADLYMHNPRGSNDRNCERNVNRNNGNRLFDSQNNDKGGYACPRAVGGAEVETPRMYYHANSWLRIEWTNQHGCGSNVNMNCEMVFQYMCEDANELISDGMPRDADDAATDRMDAEDLDLLDSTDPDDWVEWARYGYHETYDFYVDCQYRKRNRGLWISDQKVNNNIGAIATRQNNNGNRRGWECPEERDYYPYWHPTPWKDIAVLTSVTDNCNLYKTESQNVQEKYHCREADGSRVMMVGGSDCRSSGCPNDETSCLAAGKVWMAVDAHGIAAPECGKMQWTRDNHLGNNMDGEAARYNWKIPNVDCKSAVLRVRYNISTTDVPWDADHTWEGVYGDPYVEPFTKHDGSAGRYNLSYAVNTNQYGRTFQDRSYLFTIAPPKGNEVIHNLNVRGKRGNIVQTFPSVEYDFVPQYLKITEGDLVHIQWTGSDYNPDRNPNNGEGGPQDPANPGTYRADRSNMVQLTDARDSVPADMEHMTMFGSTEDVLKFAYINQDLANCLSYQDLLIQNGYNKAEAERDSRNCMKLNAAPTPYFDGGLVRPTAGTYHYFSSRNNNFSNRGQKAEMTVSPKGLSQKEQAAIGVGAAVAGVGVAGAAGYFYAKRNPASKAAKVMAPLL